MHITEFNTSYRPDNPIHDTACNAAYLAPVLAGGGDLVDSFSYWTFSDVFEEAGVPTSLFHGGFGLLTHRQITQADLPPVRVHGPDGPVRPGPRRRTTWSPATTTVA